VERLAPIPAGLTAVGLRHFAVQIARTLGAVVVATASLRHHVFVHRLGAAVVVDRTDPGWPDQIRKVTDGGAWQVLACAGPTLDGAARTARSGATIATPVHPSLPDTGQVRWQRHDGVPSGSRLIRWSLGSTTAACPAVRPVLLAGRTGRASGGGAWACPGEAPP
jgi:NADPH:quinone reductase-like Zn-dependent oxidoreductase